jgi:hypothetical protein
MLSDFPSPGLWVSNSTCALPQTARGGVWYHSDYDFWEDELLSDATHALQSCIISHHIVLQELAPLGVEFRQQQSKLKSLWQMTIHIESRRSDDFGGGQNST